LTLIDCCWLSIHLLLRQVGIRWPGSPTRAARRSGRRPAGAWSFGRATGLLKPGLPSLDISPDEILVRFRQVKYPFDHPDDARHDCADASTHDRDEQHYQPFILIAENEFMNAQGAEQDSANTG